MIIAKFLNLLSTILGGIGSILLIKAVIAMTPDVIAEMSHTDLYYSKPTLQSLASQKADVMTGATAITMALRIAFINLIIPIEKINQPYSIVDSTIFSLKLGHDCEKMNPWAGKCQPIIGGVVTYNG